MRLLLGGTRGRTWIRFFEANTCSPRMRGNGKKSGSRLMVLHGVLLVLGIGVWLIVAQWEWDIDKMLGLILCGVEVGVNFRGLMGW